METQEKEKLVSLRMKTSISVSKSNSITSSLKHIAKLFTCHFNALIISQRTFVFTWICYLLFFSFGHFVIDLRVVSHNSGLCSGHPSTSSGPRHWRDRQVLPYA